MKAVFIAYNEAVDEEVSEALEECGVAQFTKWTRVLGKGGNSGPHMLTAVWPKGNHVVFAALEDDTARKLMDQIRHLRTEIGHEGVKGFLLPVEDIT